MTHPRSNPDPDPYSEFEDEGIPDLEDSYPGREWADDPQQAPVPRDHPLALDDFGTTAEEQREGESLGGRLARERPDTAVDERQAAAEREDDPEREFDPAREQATPRRAGRLVEEDEGVRTDTEKDAVADEIGPDAGGFTAEEQAMRVEDEGI